MRIRQVLFLVVVSLLGGTACNWWPEVYNLGSEKWHRGRWNSNNVEFAKCHLSTSGPYTWDVCYARQSQLVGGCMPTDTLQWCVGQPPPIPEIGAIYVLNY